MLVRLAGNFKKNEAKIFVFLKFFYLCHPVNKKGSSFKHSIATLAQLVEQLICNQ